MNSVFVPGLGAGTSWNMLTSLQERLVVRLGRTWPALVRHLTPGGWIRALTRNAMPRSSPLSTGFCARNFGHREQPAGLSTAFRAASRG
ncbi:hypothetical protein [Streptomyces sp. NPDC101455]|uniref:hypothetical protein n=1 Tax=Streptomyces sp. NPDC101455 TaxID=3366142 RepID=UPI003805AF00